jgi:Fe-S cluster biogenesis protein NfuA
MGLLETIRSAFGWKPPLVVRDPEAPLTLSPAARARIRELPPGQGVHLETVPVDRGRLVRITEGESQGPPPEPLADWPLTLSDADLARLKGRVLDWRDGRWIVQIPFELRARETPNPDSRLYLGDQVLGVGRPAFFAPGGELPDLPARLLEIPGVRTALIRENTVAIERDPAVEWDRIDAAVDAAVREHLIRCGEPVVAGPDASSGGDPIEDEIRAVLKEQIAPAVHRDGGDIELVGFSNGVVKVAMVGACRSCPSSTATLHFGVEKTLKEAFPGKVLRVEQV